MQYWWVNHKQTSKFEIAGGFLWSPMRKKNDARNQFYDNMRLASPGDAVISYSDAQISYVGIVSDFAIPSPIPLSFGTVGQNWDQKKGWFLPVQWQSLDVPIKPKKRIHEFRHLLPEKYSPIDPVSGNGRENAYLAKIEKEIFELLTGISDFKIDSDLLLFGKVSGIIKVIDDAIERSIVSDNGLDSTTKQRLVDGRLGQGEFKKRIYEFEASCRLTGISTPALLIASHIKPWRLCSTALERLDGANGLLLSPHVDALFDRGLISFGDCGSVMVSSKLCVHDLKLLGLEEACAKGCDAFHERQIIYLDFHRKNVFLS